MDRIAGNPSSSILIKTSRSFRGTNERNLFKPGVDPTNLFSFFDIKLDLFFHSSLRLKIGKRRKTKFGRIDSMKKSYFVKEFWQP